MKKVMAVLNLSILAVFFVFLSPRGTFGAIFCVTNPTELQNALNTAARNGQDDTIQVVQGTYRGNFIYFISLDKNFKLTLQGGFTPGCTDRVVDPSNTILDGGDGADVIFILNTQIPLIRKRGHITIDGFTVRNGGTAGIMAGGARSITITNNIVSNNSSYGGVFAVSSDSITLTNNIIRDNTSSNGLGGGGVLVQNGGSIILTNNTISGNKGGIGGGHGGGVNASGGSITLTNNIIRGNTISSSGFFAKGGGVFVEGGPIILTNNTISGNKSVGFGAGGGLFINSFIAADVYNNIIFGNTADWWGDDIFIDSNAINICYNDFTELMGWLGELPQNSGVGCGDVPNSGNITADPLFVNSVGGDLHLRGSSPCINAGFSVAPGIPPHDKDGSPRVMGANVDMGAFEFVGEVCNDGVDNDGDGLADCDDPDCEAKPVCLCRCPINIPPTGCISGAVANEGTGNPLAGKTVILRRISTRKPIVRLNTVTDDGGCYQFGNLEEGTYRANVRRCRGGGTKTIVITTGRTVNNMNFECR